MIRIDDSRLQKLYADLEPKRRLQALKGAFRKEGNRFKKVAIGNLRSSIRSDRDLESGVRMVLGRGYAGFRVTVGTKGKSKKSKREYGFHTNRRGLKKPVLIWAEDGTEERKTSTFKMHGKRRNVRKRKGHRTGRMKAYRFIEHARMSERQRVTDNIHEAFRESVEKVSMKYGCKS